MAKLNEVEVHITGHDLIPVFQEVVREELADIRKRIQRLESLPGVAEALAAADTEEDK